VRRVTRCIWKDGIWKRLEDIEVWFLKGIRFVVRAGQLSSDLNELSGLKIIFPIMMPWLFGRGLANLCGRIYFVIHQQCKSANLCDPTATNANKVLTGPL
jgi:hypothetical protein